MSENALICPKCAREFPDADHCPYDGVALIRAAVAGEGHGAPRPLQATGEALQISHPTSQRAEDTPPSRDEGAPAVQPAAASDNIEAENPRTSEPTIATAESSRKIAAFVAAHRGPKGASTRAHTNDTDSRATAISLPDELQNKGWRISGPLQPRAGVDQWPIVRSDSTEGTVSGQFNRYRSGALTTEELYTRLESQPIPGLTRIWAHGTVDVAGARATYDVTVQPEDGDEFLTEWFAHSAPSEQRALQLLTPLAQLLHRLEEAAVRPIVLEPSQLVCTPENELWLASAAALADTGNGEGYRADFDRSVLLPRTWAAPELTQQAVLSANSAIFSVGQLLAQALWGQPCTGAELQSGAVAFHALANPRLARVLMGCLWPRPAERWRPSDLYAAAECSRLDTMPASPPWGSRAPGAAATAFHLAGTAFWRLEDLLKAAVRPENWNESCQRIQPLLDWAQGTAWAGHAELLRRALLEGRSADWVLIGLYRTVLPDAPPTWRTLDLSDAEAANSLAALAQKALNGLPAARATLTKLLKADLRGAFSIPVNPD